MFKPCSRCTQPQRGMGRRACQPGRSSGMACDRRRRQSRPCSFQRSHPCWRGSSCTWQRLSCPCLQPWWPFPCSEEKGLSALRLSLELCHQQTELHCLMCKVCCHKGGRGSMGQLVVEHLGGWWQQTFKWSDRSSFLNQVQVKFHKIFICLL